MADIRTLMAQERQIRRIAHEFASYTKANALMCTACQLNIRNESLWEGHLRSANHKANAKKAHQILRTSAKRKIEDLEETQNEDDGDVRKKLKPKSRVENEASVKSAEREVVEDVPVTKEEVVELIVPQHQEPQGHRSGAVTVTASPAIIDDMQVQAQAAAANVDEDEWAAFERDVAPLAQPDYSAATITAAPVSATQLEAEAEADKRKLRDAEAQDEKEDEERRMEEEFEVMEEMEERIRKLKEKRESLRLLGQNDRDTGQEGTSIPLEPVDAEDQPPLLSDSNGDSDSDDPDDWYS